MTTHQVQEFDFTTNSVPALIRKLKEYDQDHEFYPTTNEILRAMAHDIESIRPIDSARFQHRCTRNFVSILDVGAGNGKTLLYLKEHAGFEKLYAIEKSTVLIQELPPEILIAGADFHQQSLLSKKVGIIFSNPPYSEFESWSEKLINEANTFAIYLVIPVRWRNSNIIQEALKRRSLEAKIVGEYDFEEAEDRKARAKVHLLRIECEKSDTLKTNTFETSFFAQFKTLIEAFEEAKEFAPNPKKPSSRSSVRKTELSIDLAKGPQYPQQLVALYEKQIAHIQKNYTLLSEVDANLLSELGHTPKNLLDSLLFKLNGLKAEYWAELFDNVTAITNRLTDKSRRELLQQINHQNTVDFNLDNIYSIIIWTIKHANQYIDTQLISTYEEMIEKANVILYKSNQKVIKDENWRYRCEPEKHSHFYLDYRIVLHCMGGIKDSYNTRELSTRSAEFLKDLLSVAYSLGFLCNTSPESLSHIGRYQWTPGKLETFTFTNSRGEEEIILDAKAHLNGNLHIRLNQNFILKLNVAHGKLKGWLRSSEEAATELNDPKAAEIFAQSNYIPLTNPTLLIQ